MLQQCLARRHDYDPRPLVMADRGRDSSERGDDRYRQPDRSRDTDRYRDDRYDHNSRSLPSKWDWDQSGDRGGRDDRHRGQGHRRPRSRDRDTRPNKRVRNNGNTAEGKPRHTFKDSINARLGDVGKEKKLSLDIGDEDDFFKLDEEDDVNVNKNGMDTDKNGTHVSNQKTTEEDPRRLEMRTKQLSFGYNTLGYARYLELVPKNRRSKDKNKHPRTPDRSQVCSKRSFDGQVKKWRRLLHAWDPPVGDDEEVVDIPGFGVGLNSLEEGNNNDGDKKNSADVEIADAAENPPVGTGPSTASKSIYDDWEGSDDDFGGV